MSAQIGPESPKQKGVSKPTHTSQSRLPAMTVLLHGRRNIKVLHFIGRHLLPIIKPCFLQFSPSSLVRSFRPVLFFLLFYRYPIDGILASHYHSVSSALITIHEYSDSRISPQVSLSSNISLDVI